MSNRLQFYIITAFAVTIAAMYGLCIKMIPSSFSICGLVNGNGLVFNPGEYGGYHQSIVDSMLCRAAALGLIQ